MRRSSLIVLIVILVGVVIGVYFWIQPKEATPAPAPAPAPTPIAEPAAPAPTPPPPAVRTAEITMRDASFEPVELTVQPGTLVTWRNPYPTIHTIVTSDVNTDPQIGPNSGPLRPGEKYNFLFSLVGVYRYRCSIHNDIRGVVIVKN